MAAAEDVDRADEMFADIVCSDPDWVDREFEEIIADWLDAPPRVVRHPGPAGTRRCRCHRALPLPLGRTGTRRARPAIRSPPHSGGADAVHSADAVHEVGAGRSPETKGESHHVDVI